MRLSEVQKLFWQKAEIFISYRNTKRDGVFSWKWIISMLYIRHGSKYDDRSRLKNRIKKPNATSWTKGNSTILKVRAIKVIMQFHSIKFYAFMQRNYVISYSVGTLLGNCPIIRYLSYIIIVCFNVFRNEMFLKMK